MRAQDLTDILAECLDAIEKGERTVAECLSLYPEHREELGALLSTLATVKAGASYAPRPNFRLSSQARLMRRLPARTAHKSRPSIFKRLLPVGLTLTLLITSLLGAGTVYASSSALPGDTLYPVKLSVEDARLYLAEDTEDLALASTFAQTRLEEIQALIAANRQAADLDLAVELFASRLLTASKALEAVAISDPDLASQLGVAYESELGAHNAQLTRLLESAPANARAALEHALLASNREHESIQEFLGIHTPGDPPEELPNSNSDHPGGGPPDDRPNPGNPPGGGKPDDTPGGQGGNGQQNNNNGNNNRP